MNAQQSSEPVSDLAVAAQYADEELHSVTAQFANSASVSEAPKAPMVAVVTDKDDSDSDSDSSDNEAPVEKKKEVDGESSGEDSDGEGEDPAKLRAEIEAAMEKEANKTGGPLTTEHEVASIPVREPKVELTADCPIAQFGNILNVSAPGLMMTIKSNPNTKPLNEGSVLCLEDRTVIGCVDEVFGPVLMPMYLIRFENAAKMPERATVNTVVYYATEHTTYIIPEEIKDKGTDASNIFDEEADETEFSDDEAEAAAKRGNRKRNRGGAPSEGASSASSYGGRGGRGARGGRGGRGGNFTDYHARQNTSPHGTRSNYSQQPPMPPMPAIPAMQTQPYGGATKYTQPGGFGGARPVAYGSTNYTSPQGNGVPQPPMPPYSGVPVSQGQAPARGYYQPPPPPQYSAHNLPPYPPQVPYQQYSQPPSAPYGQPQPPPRAPYGQPQAPPSAPYGQPQPPRYNQMPRGAPPPPPAYYGNSQQSQQPRGPYDQRRY
ncbi:H/ACA ribonucleoprotein complex non-core subunit NAF1, putative [Phytophthora infestans T30-4]|uniref:H/ACA ribonucleoprotein complex non-core subunit NAF1 n=1 Tax=Phytophthora infestans (strain T30-4) TaxID=403677 RepID=D0N7T9_PHYIT|nr:H/ACA ribonucleoprotein complex non-core subunit NAF1, putative [Phytophthora infestans T30-4]EEY53638.1 H/ACA ribonucleoprotein complex non-core subunit NAF1, putative [Phytophthora infestans T30-4]|eukprot:XP_002905256.1 H/ACA ribonucleoprotein complex non-core subunit NAF1, putative [Phytophthora infestans T30-4]